MGNGTAVKSLNRTGIFDSFALCVCVRFECMFFFALSFISSDDHNTVILLPNYKTKSNYTLHQQRRKWNAEYPSIQNRSEMAQWVYYIVALLCMNILVSLIAIALRLKISNDFYGKSKHAIWTLCLDSASFPHIFTFSLFLTLIITRAFISCANRFDFARTQPDLASLQKNTNQNEPNILKVNYAKRNGCIKKYTMCYVVPQSKWTRIHFFPYQQMTQI